VLVKDLDGDGKKEGISGRGDGWLYVEVPKGNDFKTWRVNVGGRPIAIADIEHGEAKLATATEMGDVVYIDGVGKVLNYTRLPGQLTDLKVLDNSLLAICKDGYVYILNLDGKVLGKLAYTYNPDVAYSPKMVCGSGIAAFYSGKKAYFIVDK